MTRLPAAIPQSSDDAKMLRHGADIHQHASTTIATPDQSDRLFDRVDVADTLACNWRRKNPNRATANPTPINPRPVRIQARKVLGGEIDAWIALGGLRMSATLAHSFQWF